MNNNNNYNLIDKYKDDLIKFSELLIKPDSNKEYLKQMFKEYKNIDEQKYIIVSTPTNESSFYEKALQSARISGIGAMITMYTPRGIEINNIPNEKMFKPIEYVNDDMLFNLTTIPISESNVAELQEERRKIEELSFSEISETEYLEKQLKILNKKKTFQENFGYIKRKYR